LEAAVTVDTSRTAAAASRVGSAPALDLVLLTPEGDRFVVEAENARLVPVRVPPAPNGPADEDLAALVRRSAREAGLDVDHLGLLAAHLDAARPGLLTAAVLRSAPQTPAAGPSRRLLSLEEIRARGDDVLYAGHYDTAFRWFHGRHTAAGLPGRIRQAFARSLHHLENHLSIEDGRYGWNLHMDGTSLGVLSTAEGVLAHVHAGENGEFVDRPVEALEALQNPDGGWQVRRSLAGAQSDLSITESTCAALWALHAVGRSASDRSVAQGLEWLEALQRRDGGWPSVAAVTGERPPAPLVFPTTCAVRVLARFGRADLAAKGVAWLRAAQQDDGGWGRTSAEGAPQTSEPAYTAYAVVALLTAGLAASDPAVERGCAYLRRRFRPDHDEPWESTADTSLINPATSARLNFSHFGTPWALAALSMAGADLSDPIVLAGTDRLLKLQDPDGSWRCALIPGMRVIWATHDALYALRAVLEGTRTTMEPLALARYHAQERRQLGLAAARLLGGGPGRPRRTGRQRLHTAWLAALTVAVAVLVLLQSGVVDGLSSGSGLGKVLAGLVTALVAIALAAVPTMIGEEYRLWRSRRRPPAGD
jgi:hypothetical protein